MAPRRSLKISKTPHRHCPATNLLIMIPSPLHRVSPEMDNEESKQSKKRGKSAPEPKATPAGEERDVSPPDPLEPWSTKDLANINKLLDTDDN